jgi:hypothetical protein
LCFFFHFFPPEIFSAALRIAADAKKKLAALRAKISSSGKSTSATGTKSDPKGSGPTDEVDKADDNGSAIAPLENGGPSSNGLLALIGVLIGAISVIVIRRKWGKKSDARGTESSADAMKSQTSTDLHHSDIDDLPNQLRKKPVAKKAVAKKAPAKKAVAKKAVVKKAPAKKAVAKKAPVKKAVAKKSSAKR